MSVAQLKAECRAFDIDVKRGSHANKQRQQQREQQQRQSFQIEVYDDESGLQLLRELRSAEERRVAAMATLPSDFGSSSSSSDSTPSVQAPAPPPPSNAIEALQSSLASGKFSDLTIIHGSRRWNGHRVVVCSQSRVLESMIESSNGTNILHLDDFDNNAVCHLLEYLYGANYSTEDNAPDFSLPLHIKIFNLASSLAIPALCTLAAMKFRYNLNNYINDPRIFFSLVREIYKTPNPTHSDLRLAVLEAGISELRNLLRGPHKAEFLTLTQEITEFQTEMYLLMLENPTRPMEVVASELCTDCGPREEGDGYEVTTECKSCGQERTLTFL